YPVKAYVFTEPDDNGRVNELVDILLQHRIKIYNLARDLSSKGLTYKAGKSYVVPLKQEEYRFIRSLFEPVKQFTDSVFYDISTWVLPMSFNVRYTQVENQKDMSGLTGVEITSASIHEGRLISAGIPYAYIFEWKEYYAPKALYELQEAGIIARVASDRFTVNDGSLSKEFGYGSILIPVSEQHFAPKDLKSMMEKVASDCGITVYGTTTGMTPSGIDLGSSKFQVLQKPSVLMFAGEGANSGDAGEIWHMLDTRFRIPVTMVTAMRFQNLNLSDYNVIIIDGSPNLSQAAIDNLKAWNRSGGTIIGYKSGNSWLSRNKITEIENVPEAASKLKTGVYANRYGDSQVNDIPGSIFEATLDLTHPLCYGYTFDRLPVFKSDPNAYQKDKNIYNNPAVYSAVPLLSGYCSKANADRIKGAPFVSVHGSRIISIYDNANFRSITWGTNKIFLNSLFFGQIIGR
ncbi:MAG TPA: hypothetical protein VHO68_06075, partial [Bacteroidales bacterium]|nr:hypothetical protein [Bacteroidales bacterium]